jgi:hypothetical protein
MLKRFALIVVVLAGALIYLREPAWMAGVTSGLSDWQGPAGARFRWTTGHASFFVPGDAAAITLPLKAMFASPGGGPVTVDVSVNDRWLAAIELRDPSAWVRTTLPLPRKTTSRRFQRIDLRVSRTVGGLNRGVQLGEVELQRSKR